MALIKCQECGKEISDSAVSCPHCGHRTSRGQAETQAKRLAVKFIFTIGFLILGIILLCSGSSYINEYTSSYWGQYLWEEGYWKEDNEAVMAVVKLVIGIGILIGSLIDMIVLFYKAKRSPSEPVKTISTVDYTNSSTPANTTPTNPEYVPAWKRVQQEQDNDPQQ